MKVRLGSWLLDVDVDATRALHAALPVGTGCDCAPCRGFLAVVQEREPVALWTALEPLGIDPRKPADMPHLCRLEEGRHLYQGWYHLVGRLLEGEDCHRPVGSDGRGHLVHLEDLEGSVKIGVTERLAQVRAPEGLGPLLQVEVGLELPWRLDSAEEPD